MTNERGSIERLERVNPVPDESAVPVGRTAAELLAGWGDRDVATSSSVAVTSSGALDPKRSRRRFVTVGVAASLVALLVAAIALGPRLDRDESGEMTPATAPDGTPVPTTVDTAPQQTPADVGGLVLGVVDAVNTGDLAAAMSNFAPDARASLPSGTGATGVAEGEVGGPGEIELWLARVIGAGETWSNLACEPADEAAWSTCKLDASGPLLEAVGAPGYRVDVLATGDDVLTDVVVVADDSQARLLKRAFLDWVDRVDPSSALMPTDPVAAADAEQRRVALLPAWIDFVEAFDCPTDDVCRIELGRWTDEYEANCGPGENGVRFPSRALFEHMSAMPLPSDMTDVAAQLLARDKTLSSTLGSPGLTNEMIIQRRELLSEFGLAETCMGDL